MRIVHFTNNTFDGAGKAAHRLHKALLARGFDSKMVVLRKNIEDEAVIEISSKLRLASCKEVLQKQKVKLSVDIINIYLNKIILRFFESKLKPNILFNFNVPLVTFGAIKEYINNADVICLHSVQYFLSPELINGIYKYTHAPIVWTLMDIEPLTGGCHFNNGCNRFEEGCGKCQQLKNSGENDLSSKVFKRKLRKLKDLPITFVAGSSWVANHIKSSSIFKEKLIKNIFLSVDDIIYKDLDKHSAREALRLPQGKKIIAFGCFNLNEKRKGAKHLLDALLKMPDKLSADKKLTLKDVLLVTFGGNNGFSFSTAPLEWKHIGSLKSKQELASIYKSADVLAVPSLDDCGPMMVNEAFMCKVPVVAYNVGVSPDLIRSGEAGYIAKRYDIDDFCAGLIHCLSLSGGDTKSNEIEELRNMCTLEYQAGQYKALFEDLVSGKKVIYH